MAIYTIAMLSYPRVILMILKSMSMVELCWTKAASFVLGLSASNGRMRRARCAIGGTGSRWKIGIWDTQGWDIWCEYTVVFNFIYGYTFTYMVGGLSYVVLNPETQGWLWFCFWNLWHGLKPIDWVQERIPWAIGVALVEPWWSIMYPYGFTLFYRLSFHQRTTGKRTHTTWLSAP